MTTTAAVIVAENMSRKELTIQNQGSNTVRVKLSSGAVIGFLLYPNMALNYQGFRAALYGEALTGTASVYVLEEV